MYRYQFITAIIFSVCLAACSNEPQPDDELINQVIESMRYEEQVIETIDAVLSGLDTAIEFSSGEQQSNLLILKSSLHRYVSVDEHMESLKVVLREEFSISDLQIMLDWYDSDLGKRITALELSSSSEDATIEIEASASSLLQNEEKVSFASWYLNKHDLMDQMRGFALIVAYASYEAILSSAAQEDRTNFPEFREFEETMGTELDDYLERITIAAMVYSYQSLTRGELDQYKQYLDTDTATRFDRSMINLLFPMINNQVLAWTKDMPDILRVD